MSEKLSSLLDDEISEHRSIPDKLPISLPNDSATCPVTGTVEPSKGPAIPDVLRTPRELNTSNPTTNQLAEQVDIAGYQERAFMQPRPIIMAPTESSSDSKDTASFQRELPSNTAQSRPVSPSTASSSDFEVAIELPPNEPPANIVLTHSNPMKTRQPSRTWHTVPEAICILEQRQRDATDWVSQFSNDFSHLLFGCEDGVVELYDVGEGILRWRSTVHGSSKILSIAFNKASSRFAAAIENRGVRVWDLQGNLLQAIPGSRFEKGLVSVSFAWKHGYEGLLTIEDGLIAFWKEDGDKIHPNILSATSAHAQALQQDSNNVALSANGRILALACRLETQEIALIDTIKDELLTRVLLYPSGRNDEVHFALSPNGALLACIDSEKLVRLCHVQRRQILHSFSGEMVRFRGIAFSPDSRKLVILSADLRFHVWDCKTGKGIILIGRDTELVDDRAKQPKQEIFYVKHNVRAQDLLFSSTGDIITFETSTSRNIKRVRRIISAENLSRIFDDEL